MTERRFSSDAIKELPGIVPKMHRHPAYRAAVSCLNSNPMTAWTNISEEPTKIGSRDMVRKFLSALAPAQPYEPPVLSKDLEQLNRVVNSILFSVDQNILTPEEADAVISFIASRFASRRFDEVFSKVTTPRTGAWFVLQDQSWEE